MRRASSSRRAWRQRVRIAGGLLLLVTGCLAAVFALPQWASPSSTTARQLSEAHVRIHLHSRAANTTTAPNATAATGEGSCGQLADWERSGGIFLYIFLLSYLFVALAIVCDDYFVASLEKITEAMGLSQDVAGATFMAAGSSAPELFVSLADNVFEKPQASLGVGTIVGSAIFNILIIISLSSLLAGQVLQLDWRPLLRDSLWYCWAIVALTYAIWDGSVDIVESLVMFGSYVAYIVYMSQNERIINACCRRPEDEDIAVLEDAADRAAQLVDAVHPGGDKRAWTIDVERVEQDEASNDLKRLARVSSTGAPAADAAAHPHPHPHRLGSQSKLNPMYRSKYRMFQYHAHSTDHSERHSDATTNEQEPPAIKHSVVGSLRPLNVETLAAAAAASQATAEAKKKNNIKQANSDEDDGDINPPLGGYFDEIFDVPTGVLPKIWFIATRPIVVATRLTIPDSKFPRFSGTAGVAATFTLSIVWIAVLSHFTVVWATKFGCIAGIPSALMGLTIIAAGTSIPDAMSSVLVARDGHGDMAVSNALGSNVFDVLLGLGLPFFLSNIVYKQPVPVDTGDLELSIFMLFGVLVLVVLLLMAARWRLHPITGGIMAVLYAAYVVFSYVRGL